MDGLIFLIVLIPIVYLVLLFIIIGKSSSQQQSLDQLNRKLQQLSDQLINMNSDIKDLKKGGEIKLPISETSIEVTQAAVKFEPFADPVIIKPEVKPAGITEKQTTSAEPPVASAIQKEKVADKKDLTVETEETQRESASASWRKKADWEKFIGENLANKIGIAVLVLGISFFVKFAIDKNWINETGRVIIGLVSGGILISLAHYTRNTYRSFSSVLVGGGLTVFYFSTAFAARTATRFPACVLHRGAAVNPKRGEA